MMKTIRYAVIVAAAVCCAAPLWSLPLRSITTAEWDYYSYGDNGYLVEEVAIYTINDVWNVVAKAEWDRRPHETTVKGMGGVVFVLPFYSYMETSYGVSVADGETISHHILVDYYYERENYLLMSGVKAELSPEQNTVQPSVAGRWRGVPSFSLWGKYIASFDDLIGFDHSFWGEADYDIIDELGIKAGGTVGTYHADENAPREIEYSGLGGLVFRPAEGLSFTYLFEYLVRQQYEVISNSLVADIRF